MPASVVCAVLAEPIVRIVYQRGDFTAAQTPVVAGRLAAFSLGLAFNGAMLMLNRAFFSPAVGVDPDWVALGNLGAERRARRRLLPARDLGHSARDLDRQHRRPVALLVFAAPASRRASTWPDARIGRADRRSRRRRSPASRYGVVAGLDACARRLVPRAGALLGCCARDRRWCRSYLVLPALGVRELDTLLSLRRRRRVIEFPPLARGRSPARRGVAPPRARRPLVARRHRESLAEYRAAIEGREPTDHFLIVVDGSPVGMIQTYLVSDYPEWEAVVQVGEGSPASTC